MIDFVVSFCHRYKGFRNKWSCLPGTSFGCTKMIAFFRFSAHLLEESIRSRSGLDVPESPALARTGFKMNAFSQLMPLNGLEQMSLEIGRSIVNVQRNVHAKLILFNLGVEMMRAFKLKE